MHTSTTGAAQAPSTKPQAPIAGASDAAYRIHLMQRAMRRTDAELHGFRHRYEAAARRLAAELIGAGCARIGAAA